MVKPLDILEQPAVDYGCKFLNDNAICEMRDARLPVFLPNLNLTNCPNCLIVSA